jgi:ATP-dependent DNA helicase RecQ
MPDLASLLQRTFGHTSFRANQEAVCRAATDGRDVLLVMPTGAGKSLCYQLPAIARGGTALVVSPLIALMDDQAAKLSSHGLRVARIHSGLSREDSRQACHDYLAGTLDFLFIAPERLRVTGFPEMLARRKPALIAIDEAHCISAWGHDFRPDYRTLGEHLPALRPAPIIALTATATPTVQQDIVAQLHLQNPALFIHGFRRSNLAIEVVEMSKPRRHEFTTQLLSNPANRPAIVYAPSRKSAEELAAELNRAIKICAPFIASSAMSGSGTIAAAYHAGLEPSVRERVQQAFQSGKLEVVVATIAFGMGIDKADVRTVVHTALPASVEAFYQEIGRAGRDGLPSRTVLLHSYADRKMHEFFLDRDYPPATDLARVAQVLTDEYLMPEPLAQRLKMDLETFSKSIEKLIGQGAATTDLAGNVRATKRSSTPESWRSGYDAQIAFRRSQIDRMSAFAETQQCRMTAVIRHFGDTADAHRPWGQCDFCSPSTTSAQTFAPPTSDQARDLRAILRVLESRSTSTGKLHTELGNGTDRHTFDVLLDALARAGLITLATDTFTSKDDGRVIPYKKAALTHEGRSDDAHELAGVVLPAEFESDSTAARSSRKSKRATKSRAGKSSPDASANLTAAQKQLDEALRAWRKSEAAKTGKPAFIVLSDAVLRNIATAEPQSISELLTVPGIGPNKADKFGAVIIALCRNPSTKLSTQSEKPPRTSTKPASSLPKRNEAEGSAQLFRSAAGAESEPVPFHRTRLVESDPTAALTTEQQLLDAQLRAWRKSRVGTDWPPAILRARRFGSPQHCAHPPT